MQSDSCVVYPSVVARSHVKMPTSLLAAYEAGVPLTGTSLLRGQGADTSLSQGQGADTSLSQGGPGDRPTADELAALVQWSDLILFDFITGHYDRYETFWYLVKCSVTT